MRRHALAEDYEYEYVSTRARDSGASARANQNIESTGGALYAHRRTSASWRCPRAPAGSRRCLQRVGPQLSSARVNEHALPRKPGLFGSLGEPRKIIFSGGYKGFRDFGACDKIKKWKHKKRRLSGFLTFVETSLGTSALGHEPSLAREVFSVTVRADIRSDKYVITV